MSFTPHLIILNELCRQTDYLEHEKESFRPEFYRSLNAQLSTVKLALLEEMTLISGGSPRAASTTEQELPTVTPSVTPENNLQMDEKSLMELADVFDDDDYTVSEPPASTPTPAPVVPVMTPHVSTPEPIMPSNNNFVPQESINIPQREVVPTPEQIPVMTPPMVAPTVQVATPVINAPRIEPATAIIDTPTKVFKLPTDIAKKLSERQWELPADDIICQTQKIMVTRDGKEFPITLSIAPLQVVENGLVPVMVNAEYESFSIQQMTTLMSEPGEPLLQMDVDNYTFLIKGSFSNGVFNASITSTGRSIEHGDSISVLESSLNSGTCPVAEIHIHDNATLWLAFSQNIFFGVLYAGEWIDEFNANHDVMIESGSDYNELRLTQNGSNWMLSY